MLKHLFRVQQLAAVGLLVSILGVAHPAVAQSLPLEKLMRTVTTLSQTAACPNDGKNPSIYFQALSQALKDMKLRVGTLQDNRTYLRPDLQAYTDRLTDALLTYDAAKPETFCALAATVIAVGPVPDAAQQPYAAQDQPLAAGSIRIIKPTDEANVALDPARAPIPKGDTSHVKINRSEVIFDATEVNTDAADQQVSLTMADMNSGATLTGLSATIAERWYCDKSDAPSRCSPVPATAAEQGFTHLNYKPRNFTVTKSEGSCTSAMANADSCIYTLHFRPIIAGDVEATLRFDYSVNGVPLSQVVSVRGSGYVSNVASIDGDGAGSNNPSTRLIMGLDISGSTNASVQQKYYVDAALNAPIGWSRNRVDPLNRGAWWFFNPRLTSVNQAPTAFSNLNVQGFADFLGSSSNKTDLVQGLDMQGGIELCPEWLQNIRGCAKPRSGIPFYSSYKNMHARIGIYWVGGFGFTTPFASAVNNTTVFSLADANGKFPGQDGYVPPTNIPDPNKPDSFIDFSKVGSGTQGFAFVLDDRSRFYRKFYAGLRLKTYHFTDLVKGKCDDGFQGTCEAVYNDYPGVVDLTAGKDEQVTGGKLRDWVFRVDANYPLPFAPYLHVLASLNSSFGKNKTTAPFVPPATLQLPLGSPAVDHYRVTTFPDRDIFRLGIGVDLSEIYKALSKKDLPKKQTAGQVTASGSAGAANSNRSGNAGTAQ